MYHNIGDIVLRGLLGICRPRWSATKGLELSHGVLTLLGTRANHGSRKQSINWPNISNIYRSSPTYIISGRKQDIPFPTTEVAQTVFRISSIKSKGKLVSIALKVFITGSSNLHLGEETVVGKKALTCNRNERNIRLAVRWHTHVFIPVSNGRQTVTIVHFAHQTIYKITEFAIIAETIINSSGETKT